MLPGISAEDCLFADLEIDPARQGLRSYEATDFLISGRPVDPTSGLVLWQVGAIGVATFYRRAVWRTEGLAPLVETLLDHYPADHEVILYTAATLPVAAAGDPPASTAGADRPTRRGRGLGRRDPLRPAGTAGAGRPGGARAPGARPGRDGDRAGADRGMLSVVGLGYNVSGQVTPETRSVMRGADRLFYLVTDPAMAAWLRSLKPDATSLHDCYRDGESGIDASNAMVARILEPITR